MVRVVVVGSVHLYREGLADALGRRSGFAVVGRRVDIHDVLGCIKELAPDVIVLLDIRSRPDLNLARSAEPDVLRVPVVALGISAAERDVLAGLRAGTVRNLTQDASLDELAQVVESTARGEVSRLQSSSSRAYTAAARTASSPSDLHEPRLTPREREIGNLLRRNLSNKEIAALLGIEVATVKNHVHSVLEKLRVHRRTEAARLIHRARLVLGPILYLSAG